MVLTKTPKHRLAGRKEYSLLDAASGQIEYMSASQVESLVRELKLESADD